MSKVVICKCCGHQRIVFTGNELKRHRLHHKMSLAYVAKELKLSVSYISDCEHDRRNSNEQMTAYWKSKDNPMPNPNTTNNKG